MEHEKHKSHCIFCGCSFLHARNHPQQLCCSRKECKRKLDSLRQQKCRNRRNNDPVRRVENCQKQKLRYENRKKRRQNNIPPKPPPSFRPPMTASAISDCLAGVFKELFNCSSADEIYRVMEIRREAGRYLRL